MIAVDTLVRDIRFSFRSLRRDLGVTVFVLAIAGIGIGASTTVFSLCHALILRPLPFDRPERLAWIANGTSENLSAQTVQVNNLIELRERSRSWIDIAGFYAFYAPGDLRFTGAGEPERLTGVPVTQNFFPLLGVRPLAGRFFDSTESRFNGPRAVVLGHDFWQRRFAGDRGIVGRTIVLNDSAATVIGVLPPSFDFSSTFTPGRRADLFLAFPLSPETNRQGNTLALVGRLRDGASLEGAQSEATSIGEGVMIIREGDARRNRLAPRLMTLRERVSGRFQSALFVLSGAVSFLMLLVCANLSNLLLVRASSRRREMAIRTALGAPRQHLIRQMLVESVVLNAGGAVLGIVLAAAGTFAISRLQGTTIPLLNDVQVDTAVLGFAVLVTVATGIAFGLLPALHASAFSLPSFLAEGSRGSTGRTTRMRNVIVVAQVALVCVLLTGAGLLARSLARVLDVRPGFSTENAVVIRVDPGRSRGTVAEAVPYFDAVVREVRSLAGVQSAGLTDALPLGDNFGWRRWTAWPADRPRPERQDRPGPLVRMIDEGYMATMRIPLRSGRAFTVADDRNAEPVVIISRRLAEVFWPGVDPIDRVLHTSGKDRRVVGVVGAVRYFGLDREADIEMYMPLRTGDYQSVDLVVRGSLPPQALIGGIRAALRRVDPTLPVAEFRTMEQLVDRSVFARRFVVLLVAGFAGFGLLLASLGIYAVISYSVAQRTQEIGIRMALGATPGNLRAHVLGQTGRLALIGAAVGLPLSWMAARAIQSLLYDVGASDPGTFGLVIVTLTAVAALAGYMPARRATQVDPAIALRPR
jgi:putative ABC transport system permease protein